MVGLVIMIYCVEDGGCSHEAEAFVWFGRASESGGEARKLQLGDVLLVFENGSGDAAAGASLLTQPHLPEDETKPSVSTRV